MMGAGARQQGQPWLAKATRQWLTRRDFTPDPLSRGSLSLLKNRLAGLLPVGKEGVDALVGQWMFDQGLHDDDRYSHNIGTGESCIFDVVHGAHRGSKNL